MSGTTITTVYAPDMATAAAAEESVRATCEAAPGWKHVVAIDEAPADFVVRLLNNEMTDAPVHALTLKSGMPPRMGMLVAEALKMAEGEFVLTVEQDVILDHAQTRAAVKALQELPHRVAALYLQSTDDEGKPNYPWTVDWPKAKEWAEGFREPRWPTLNCTLWRRRALEAVDFSKVPALEFVDGYIGDRLKERGYTCLMTDKARCVHRPHLGRKCMAGRARTLAINCRGIWAQRGINFDWTPREGLDVCYPRPFCLPFDAESFREVYICDRDVGPDDLAEFARVLRREGRLEICGCSVTVNRAEVEDAYRVTRWDDSRKTLWRK